MKVKIGFFADAHYARGVMTGTRQCGRSIEKLRALLPRFFDCAVIVNLGDLIQTTDDDAQNAENLRAVHAALSDAPAPVCHLAGNHDLERMDKSNSFMFMPAQDGSCTVSAGGWTILFLDANFTPSGISYGRGVAHDWRESYVPPEQLCRVSAALTRGCA